MNNITREELEVIHKQVYDGGKAEIALEVLDSILKRIIEKAKDEFVNLPLDYYQNIDNTKIYVIKSRINIAQIIGTEIRRMIDDGKRAENKLINGDY